MAAVAAGTASPVATVKSEHELKATRYSTVTHIALSYYAPARGTAGNTIEWRRAESFAP